MGTWMAARWLLAIGAILTAGGLTATEQPGVVAAVGAYKTGQGVPKY